MTKLIITSLKGNAAKKRSFDLVEDIDKYLIHITSELNKNVVSKLTLKKVEDK